MGLAARNPETGETATLEIWVDGNVLILEEVVSRHLVGTAQSIGTRWSAHATSTGKVLLAHLHDAWQQAVSVALPQFTSRTITTSKALQAELAHVRRTGYATAVEELELGFVAAGAALFDYDGRAVAAISVRGPILRLTTERLPRIAALVEAAAERISRRLGHQPAHTGQAQSCH